MAEKVDNWKGCPPPSKEPMIGQYCDIVLLEPDKHCEALWEEFAADTTDIDWKYLWVGPFANIELFRDFLVINTTGSPDIFYAILNKAGRPLGMASYLNIVPQHGSVEVGHIHLSPRMQRTPASTEYLYLMSKHVFDLGYRRFEWKCDSLNKRSQTTAKRFGFKFEAIFRQHYVIKGLNRDSAYLSIIDKEWPAIENAVRQWLSAENFDESGKQIKKLQDFQ